MRTINIMSGIPGCGKTTYIEKNAEWCDVALHRDEFRAKLRESMNTTEYFPVPAAKEWELWIETITTALTGKQNVWIDQTTIGTGALAKLLKALPLTEDDTIIIHVFNPSFQTALARNALRSGLERVPEDVMLSMHRNFTKNLITKSSARRVAVQCNIFNTITVQFHNQ